MLSVSLAVCLPPAPDSLSASCIVFAKRQAIVKVKQQESVQHSIKQRGIMILNGYFVAFATSTPCPAGPEYYNRHRCLTEAEIKVMVNITG
ncbi:hypothetical protein BL250_08505 [Erwinia sp. OLTSP20]|nr:hypothetical protein BV501_04535 [Erwinia sp. OAMSP11]PIJ74089.1 hypothetical protein BK416_04825 [Erwinia sp. OLSSP12]PIJ81195.1 hypothetical protein BLD47_09670 [Erwinia sp. OLCASP19]PIJ86052.1 hypothetical protein BLD46_04620 [Erwinia sp. OLMTSP26]PIJ87801.1 hypothetical protein BLD49_04620 [Erwinia sp. OLMDSP33]PIJ90833.1 hypothetical protein BL249_11040 [Erwinia sp. OLFS4]PIJ92731.1 hypothetical protein BL250_08505 [Erwinia sp. OLTSP20]